VLAGHPLGVDEGHGAGLDGNGLDGVEDFARSVGEVDGEGDGCGFHPGLGAGNNGGSAERGQRDET
jgi:hypothetical protein